jgi:hypothetical protein
VLELVSVEAGALVDTEVNMLDISLRWG